MVSMGVVNCKAGNGNRAVNTYACARLLKNGVQLGIELHHIGRCKLRVVQIRERPATRQHATSVVIAHGFELPNGPHALEVANVRPARQMHAMHVGVNVG